MIKHWKNLFCWTGCIWCCRHPCLLVFLCLYTVKTEFSIVLCYPYKQLNEISPLPLTQNDYITFQSKIMGLCKCPKRKVTNQFCFEHRVNVCEHCMVNSHKKVCFLQFFFVSFSVLRRTERWFEIYAFLLIGLLYWRLFCGRNRSRFWSLKIWSRMY